MTPSVRNFLWLLLLASFWGPSFLFIKVAVEYVEPLTITAIRMGIGSLILYAILKFQKVKLPKLKKVWKHFTVAALFQGAIPFTLFAVGEKTIDSSIASIISGSTSLFTMVLAHYFVKNDRFTAAKLTGSCLGFFGLFMLIAPALLVAQGSFFGFFTFILASMCYAIAFVYVKKFIDISKYPPLTVPAIQLFISFLVLSVAALILEDPLSITYVSTPAILSILGLGVFGTALAFTVYYKLISLTNISYIAMVNYIVPVFGVVLGMLVLDEKLAWNSYLGCLMVLFGVMIANGMIKVSKQKNIAAVM